MATKVKLIADSIITTDQLDTTSLDAHFTGGTGVTYSGGTISIGQAVHSTDSPTFADLTVTGNLNITGDINSYNVTDLDVTDKTITLGAGQIESNSGGSGIIVDGSGASILWDESNTEWDFNNAIHVNGGITFGVSDSTLADNNIRFKSTGAAYIDHNTVGQDINFRISNASALDTTIMTLDAGVGSVGINQTSPSSTYKLDVGGSIRSASASPGLTLRETDASNQTWLLGSYGGTLAIRDVTGGTYPVYVEAATPTNTLHLKSNGNVGINVNNPLQKFHLYGDGGYYASIQRGNSTPGGSEPWLGLFNDTNIANATYGWGFYDSNADGSLQIWNKDSSTTAYNIMTFQRGGNVGIGTNSPYKKLEVVGDIQLDATDANIWIKSGAVGTNGFINWTFNTNGTVYNKIGMDYDTRASTGFHIDAGYPITIDASASGGKAINFDIGGVTKAVIDGVGKVGIGTSAPGRQLEIFKAGEGGAYRVKVKGDTGYTGIEIENTASENTNLLFRNPSYTQELYMDAAGKFHVYNNGVHRFTVDQAGNVGIGTTSPNSWASYTDSAATVLQVEDSSQRARIVINGGNGAHLDLVDYAGSANDKHMNIAVDSGVLKFGSLNDAGNAFVQNNIMTMDLGTGNVGIGTSSPVQALEVDGDVRIKDARSLFFKRHGDNYAWRIRNESAADSSTYGFDGSNDLVFEVVGNSNVQAAPTAASHSIYASSANTLVLKETGRVGIGTASPESQLEVNEGSNYRGVHVRGSNTPSFTMAQGTSSTPSWRLGISGYDGNDLAISTGSTVGDQMRMDPSGNVMFALGTSNFAPRQNLNNESPSLQTKGPIVSGHSQGSYTNPARNIRDWFVYAGPPTNTGSYVHMKTDLDAGTQSNSQFTMSSFTYHNYYAYGGTFARGQIGWHNWSGTLYNVMRRNEGTLELVQPSYVSSDGNVVLVARIDQSYAQFSIDWFQWGGYTFREAKVTAVTQHSAATGAY